jgi:hypothetical protein
MNIIYEVFDPVTNKRYIGSKSNYKGTGTYYGSPSSEELKSIIRERKETLIFNILEEVENFSELISRENFYQKKFKVVENPNYWNIKYAMDWNYYMLGRKHKESTKEKISESNKNKKLCEEVKKKISNKVNLIFSEKKSEYWSKGGLQKMSEGGKRRSGYIPTKEHREKISRGNKGKVHTEDQNLRVSNKIKERYLSSSITNGMSKKIYRLNTDQEIIEEYRSISEVSRKFNILRYAFVDKYLNKSVEFEGSYWVTSTNPHNPLN